MKPCGDSIRVVQPQFQVEGEGSIPISPLHLDIHECHLSIAKELNRLWHSSLPEYATGFMPIARICFVAEYKNRYYASAIWNNSSSPAFARKPWLELRRMAIASDAPKNTASRMIKIMISKIRIRFPDIEKLISYQDTSVHEGTIYRASGWLKAFEGKQGMLRKGGKREINTGKISYPKVRWEFNLKKE